MREEVSLQIASLHSADFDELGDGPALRRYRLTALSAKIKRLLDGRADHLARLLDRSALSLHLGQLGDMDIDEPGLITLEHGCESMLAHAAQTVHARRRHRLGQAELAKRLGTDQPAISRIERDVVSPSIDTLNRIFEAMGETLVIHPTPLNEPPPGGGNQSIAELRADYRQLSPEERLEQGAMLSELGTELAAGGED